MSLYNKYRPKSFDDLIQSKFNNKFELNHHSYLFFGPSGTGKTSAARLFMCQYVADKDVNLVIAGKHLDYIEINCAVNNGVDDIRAIVSDIVGTSPASNSQYKFIVFDECHMLSVASQNALLKTVEEPPHYIKFFFCTTEINKVLPTIRSRCQIVPFIKIHDKGIMQILETVCKGEGFNSDSESLKLITSCADGSGRNAINLLEQCSCFLNDTQSVANILGTASNNTFELLTDYICSKKRVDTLVLVDEMISNSLDPNTVFNKYADYIAEQIICRLTQKNNCKYEGKQLLLIAECVTNILKDFKILQNIKLISKLHILKMLDSI